MLRPDQFVNRPLRRCLTRRFYHRFSLLPGHRGCSTAQRGTLVRPLSSWDKVEREKFFGGRNVLNKHSLRQISECFSQSLCSGFCNERNCDSSANFFLSTTGHPLRTTGQWQEVREKDITCLSGLLG